MLLRPSTRVPERQSCVHTAGLPTAGLPTTGLPAAASEQCVRVQTGCCVAKSDAAAFLRQLELMRSEVDALKHGKRRAEEETRARMASIRAERDAEVNILARKLEEAISSYNRSVTEAERMLTAKEGLLRKYKVEARSLAAKYGSEQVGPPPQREHRPRAAVGVRG